MPSGQPVRILTPASASGCSARNSASCTPPRIAQNTIQNHVTTVYAGRTSLLQYQVRGQRLVNMLIQAMSGRRITTERMPAVTYAALATMPGRKNPSARPRNRASSAAPSDATRPPMA